MRASDSSLSLETSVVTVFVCHRIEVFILNLTLCGDVVENDLFLSGAVPAEFKPSIPTVWSICNDKSLLHKRGERCCLTVSNGLNANRHLKPSIGFIVDGTSPTFCTLLRRPPQCTTVRCVTLATTSTRCSPAEPAQGSETTTVCWRS
jgi:hypothetical protein